MLAKLLLILFILPTTLFANVAKESSKAHVAVMNMDMMIAPGTQGYLEGVIEQAYLNGAKIIIAKLDTPGGMLGTSQEMIQAIFQSPIPIIVYVNPTGATATSAGVFITMAGHVAAMSPGTSIGAAHPVAGDGKDIEGDMRKKAENMTVAMVKSISEERGRNVEWAEKSVKDSDSLTEKEALEKKVIDFVANDIGELLEKIKGIKVKLKGQEIELDDYSSLPIQTYEIGLRNKVLNFLSNPNIAALLWLGATSGLSLELYNPGAILPGVVGVICLVLALAVMQILPISQTGIILLVVGSLMLVAEIFVPSGILAIGGLIALVIGAIYLVDPMQAPGISVDPEFIIPVAFAIGVFMLWVLRLVVRSQEASPTTAGEGLVGMKATAEAGFKDTPKVFVNGEIWNARLEEGDAGAVQEGDLLEVLGVDHLTLEVKPIEE